MTQSQTVLNYINGQSVAAQSGATFDKAEPATGLVRWQVASARAQDVDQAVEAAQAAFKGPWSALSGAARGRLIHRLADLLEARATDFAELLAREQGRPPSDLMMMDLPMWSYSPVITSLILAAICRAMPRPVRVVD